MTLADRIDAFLNQRNLPIHQALDLLEEARDELRKAGEQAKTASPREKKDEVNPPEGYEAHQGS